MVYSLCKLYFVILSFGIDIKILHGNKLVFTQILNTSCYSSADYCPNSEQRNDVFSIP